MKLNTRQMTHAALLVAVSIVMTRLGSLMIGGIIRLSFGGIPIYMGGLLFGPVVGGMVGALADGLGYFINTFGAAFAPQIFFASVFRGIIPPLAARLVPGKNWYWKVFVAILLTEIVSGLLLTTWGLSLLWETPFVALLPARLTAFAVQVPVYTVLTYLLTARLRSYVAALRKA